MRNLWLHLGDFFNLEKLGLEIRDKNVNAPNARRSDTGMLGLMV